MEYDSLFALGTMYRISRLGLCWHTVGVRLNLSRVPVCIAAYTSVYKSVCIAARIGIGDDAAKGRG